MHRRSAGPGPAKRSAKLPGPACGWRHPALRSSRPSAAAQDLLRGAVAAGSCSIYLRTLRVGVRAIRFLGVSGERSRPKLEPFYRVANGRKLQDTASDGIGEAGPLAPFRLASVEIRLFAGQAVQLHHGAVRHGGETG